MAMGFTFKLELADGTPADPPTFRAVVPNWRPGDTIHLPHRTLRVVRVRDDDADQAPVLVVEDRPDRPLATPAETGVGSSRGRVVGSVLGVRLATRPRFIVW